MNIKITGKELKVTDAIKEYLDKKIERIAKYFSEDMNTTVTMKTEGNNQIAEIQVTTSDGMFRAVTEHKDLYAAIDKNIDILEGQIRKMKTKKDRQNMIETIRISENMSEKRAEIENEIIKITYFDIKPISPEDAKLELKGRPKDRFLLFMNIETGKPNVIYRLKDNKNFGIVEPEC
ncbi:MAG: ribosome-associated translation inhibitor RaiA [Clostridia bacterium]|nr:ribosome-associated translation inhibitor RaiA [Clostridia bacterium]